MDYLLPKEIHKSLNVSLKTIYNYLKKYPDKIRTKKEFGKLFVHVNDITKIIQNLQNTYKNHPKSESKEKTTSNFESLKEQDSKFQKLYNKIQVENTALSNRNDVLERQLKQYGELFMTEKGEKKEWIDKYDAVQKRSNQTLRKYYISLSISVFLALIIVLLALLSYLGISISI